MSANRSAFPKGKRRQLWDAVIARVKGDPVIKRCVQTLVILDGTDKAWQKDWTLAELPGLAVSAFGQGSRWNATRDFKAPIVFTFELAIASTAYPDLLDFWESIETAFFPGSPGHGSGTIQDTMRAIVQGQEILSPGVNPKFICDERGLSTEGQIVFNFHRFT